MEDQQIEMMALSNVNSHIEQIENSQQIVKYFQVPGKHLPLELSRKQLFSSQRQNIIPLHIDSKYSKKISLIQFQINQVHSVFISITTQSMKLQNMQQYLFIQFQQVKYQASINNPYWWRIISFLRKETTILLPADSFLFVWDVILMFVTIINIFYVPVQLSFELDVDDMGALFILFSTIPSCIFVIDLVLCFFKGYYDKGILRTKKSEIFWHYVSTDLCIDLAIILPFVLSFFGYNYANYLMLIRMTRVRRTMLTIEEIANFKERSAVIYQLFCLIYSLVLISHFCACLFHYMAIYEMEKGYTHTWLHAQNIADSENYVKYFTSLYWITITSMTVGYGDVVPVTLPEKIVVTFITFLVTGVFGYALGMIQSIFYKMAEQQNINNSKLRLVSNHIKQRGLNPQLQFRVRKYIEYYLQFKQEEELDLDELMGQLNPKLKKEVQVAMYSRYITNSKLFGTNFSEEILEKLCYCIHEKTFAPEEIIMKQGEVPDKFYIVLSGRIKSSLLHEAIRRYRSGQLICEKEFFLQEILPYDMIASTFVNVAYLNYSEFQEILKKNLISYEKYRNLVDNTIFGSSSQQIICEACLSHHQFKHCPLVFFRKNKEKVIAQYNNSVNQVRQPCKRNKKYHFKISKIRDRAYDQIVKMQQELGLNLNQKYLGKLGYQQFKEEDDSNDGINPLQFSCLDFNQNNRPNHKSQTVLQDYQHHSPSQQLQQKNDTSEDYYSLNIDIDKANEFEIYNPHYNLNKVIKMINKQQLYARILEKMKKHKNKFATLIAQKVMLQLL